MTDVGQWGELNRKERVMSSSKGISKSGHSVEQQNRWVDLIIPSIFTIILLACLVHLGYSAMQSWLQSTVGYHYAISAFAV